MLPIGHRLPLKLKYKINHCTSTYNGKTKNIIIPLFWPAEQWYGTEQIKMTTYNWKTKQKYIFIKNKDTWKWKNTKNAMLEREYHYSDPAEQWYGNQ